MANNYRSRICAVGDEQDMIRLCKAMLSNIDWLDEPEDRTMPYTLAELQEKIQERAQEEGGNACEFLYEMIARRTYGDAEEDSCRFAIRQEACELWTASFDYCSEHALQVEDWVKLHNQVKQLPMLILRAGWDFSRDKGMLILSGGRAYDDWNFMGETWLWLIAEYECGYPPEEAVARLEKLEKTLEKEEFDLSISELLASSMEHLQHLGEYTAAGEQLKEAIARCIEESDFKRLFLIQGKVAETVLWQTEHNGRWLACLEAVKQAWDEKYPPEEYEEDEDE